MRKHIGKLAVALTLAPLCAMADEGDGSGFFAGIYTGYTAQFHKTAPDQGQGGQNTATTGSNTTAPAHINVGVRLGYNYYFMDFLGFRGYLDYSYGFSHSREAGKENNARPTDTNSSLHHVTINADVLVNIFNSDSVSFGAFAGVGLGYEAMSQTSNENNTNTITQVANGFALPINVGLSLTAGGHHRFEFGVKIPTFGIKAVPVAQDGGNNQQQQTNRDTYRNLITQIGYSYIF